MGDAEQNELTLVCAARQGDKGALQALLNRNWGWLKGLVYSALAGKQDVDDVMQEVCVRVITKIHTVREPERFRAWLAILARRAAIQHYRRSRPEVVASKEPIHVDDPSADLERRELCGRVLTAVRGLPPKYREVFILAHSGELTYTQMAEALDIPITTMQIRLVRARQMVRNRVAGMSEQKVHER